MELVEKVMLTSYMLAAHEELRDLPHSEQNQRLEVVQEAMSWIGTPYHHMGRVKGAGVDCGMLLAEVYERAGVMPRIEPEAYPADWHMHRSEERYLGLVQDHAAQIEGLPRPGDIALFKWGKCLSHGAIVIRWPEVVHAYMMTGSVVLDDAERNHHLGPKLAGFWSPWEVCRGR